MDTAHVNPIPAWLASVVADAKAAANEGVSLPYNAAVTYARLAGGLYVGKIQLDVQGNWADNPNPAMRITPETRQAIREALIETLEKGDTYVAMERKICHLVQDVEGASPILDETGRSLAIALTEMAIAMNMGALANFLTMETEFVEVTEGENCNECRALDGKIWSIAYAFNHPLGHPCCQRAFIPTVDFEGTPDDPPEGSPLGALWVGHQY